MRTVTAEEAEQSFEDCLASAEAGEEVIITREGKPTAVLRPYPPPERGTSPPETPVPTPQERQAAVERAIARLKEGLPLGVLRPFTRDEMHER